ncbi:MAG: HNH endonuclease [Ideonella sp.]|nr:HNH endonuclease [Ideonella sp.]
MARTAIPKKTSESVLREYNHRCAICGSDRPHLHHIDEDATNNAELNLLPLCPNCHLRDQHNPTHKIEPPKLQLFRQHKDPAILKPQFHPIFVRQAFLATVQAGDESVAELERCATELIEIVQALAMGDFYGKRLTELLAPLRYPMTMRLEGPDPEYQEQIRRRNRDYRLKLIANGVTAQDLVVEQLRYQAWANEA